MTVLTMRDHAHALAKRGFHIFPLLSGTKDQPLIKDFQNKATRDTAQIDAWWRQWPDANVAISTTRFGDRNEALIVIDVDEKNGKKGGDLLVKLEVDDGLDFPVTAAQETTTKGQHIIYKAPAAVVGRVDQLGPGLDIRSHHNYIVGAGSTIDGKPYTVLCDAPVADAPAWLPERCSKPREKTKNETKKLEGVDADAARDRVIRYLKDEAPASIKGQGGDQTAYRVACQCKDLGVDDAAITLELMLDSPWHKRSLPGWSPERLKEKVDHAYQYGVEAIGARAPEAVFPELTPEEQAAAEESKAPAKPSRFKFVSAAEFKKGERQGWHVKHVIPAAELVVVFGASTAGKSFWVFDVVASVERGAMWRGTYRTTRGRAAYIFAEGSGGARGRIDAYEKHHGVTLDKLFVLGAAPNLLESADVAELIAELKALGPLSIVVCDTYAQMTAGGDENSGEHMGRAIANCKKIHGATGATVILVAHSGKDRTKGVRGWSGIKGAIDAEIEIVRDGDCRTATVTKMKDGPGEGSKMPFKLVCVPLGEDEDGDTVFSCVVEHTTAEPKSQPIKADSVAGKALATIEDLRLDPAIRTKPILLEEWRDEFARRHYPGKPKAAWTAFARALPILETAGRITKDEGQACLK